MKAFDKLVRFLASRALMEGVVGIEDLEHMCNAIDKDAYQRGYDKDHKDGYTQAVADAGDF